MKIEEKKRVATSLSFAAFTPNPPTTRMLQSTKHAFTAASVVATLALASAASNAAAISNLGNKLSETTGVSIRNDDLPMLSKGVQEFGLSGKLNWEDETEYALDLSYGRFVTDGLLLGVKGGVFGENSDASFNFGIFGEYNFNTGTKWVPFIGLGAEWARVDDGAFDADAIRLRGEFGVKYFLRENMAISIGMSGSWISNTTPDGEDFGKQINFGIRSYF